MSVDSHVSIPVVVLPIDAQSVDVDDNIGDVDNVDGVVENQQPQPEGPPPPPTLHCVWRRDFGICFSETWFFSF